MKMHRDENGGGGGEEGVKSTTPVLTHLDERGEARMVDVSEKPHTMRSATASARVMLGQSTFSLVASSYRGDGNRNRPGKGNVLGVSQLAGIMGAKQTSNLIPLCHPVALSNVDVDLVLVPSEYAVDVTAKAVAVGPTGVEMEALTAASVAALTVYDMCKSTSKSIEITSLRLLEKVGGKSGLWRRS